ncbi:MAG: DUF3368 domain-containing protein [Chitinophagales bacterium]|nr:DUF3368 domain-containing protein [Chitinophagales bacterium]
MIVVSDTTAISSLYKINHLHLLRDIFGEVIVPVQVYEELKYFEKLNPEFNWSKSYAWIKPLEVQQSLLYNNLQNVLDEGESAAIALTIQIHADLLLIDEKLGRKIAAENGVRVIGLVGVLELAKKRNLISVIKPVMDELIHTADFRISKKLYEHTLRIANEK